MSMKIKTGNFDRKRDILGLTGYKFLATATKK